MILNGAHWGDNEQVFCFRNGGLKRWTNSPLFFYDIRKIPLKVP